MDIHKAFMQGAQKLALSDCEYTSLHKGHGIEQHYWDLLTQKEYWSPEQARQVRTIMAAILEISLTIAGMPAIPLPGQYVAAMIATIVAPQNRLLACTKAPDTFDAVAAAGIVNTHEVKPMSNQQLMGLVLAYSGGFTGEPTSHRVSSEVTEIVRKSNKGK